MSRSLCWIAALLLLTGMGANAHTASSSFLTLAERDNAIVAAEVDFALRDLNQLLQLDADLDGALTWGEVQAASSKIESLVLTRMALTAGGASCETVRHGPPAIAEHGDGPYARVSFTFQCPAGGGALAVNYAGWFEFDAKHRGLLEFHPRNAAPVQAILTQAQPHWRASASRGARTYRFLIEGMRHLVAGHDHLAFLGVLLLALVRRKRVEEPVALDASLRGALGVITAFTAAHSVTLGLAATGHLALPSQPVEIVIAASVMFAALLNLGRSTTGHGWKLAFGFGLVHGLGFAGALAELTSERLDWLALAAFNVGIELAQVAIAAVAVPLMWWLCTSARRERVGVPLISCAVAGLAGVWVVGRVLPSWN